MKLRKAIVIGASSGIGAALVRRLAAEGHTVAALARRADKLEELANLAPDRVFAIPHDVKDTEEVPELLAAIAHKMGGLDLVIYSSGVMPDVTKDPFNYAVDAQMIDVNIAGAVAWLNAAANRFDNVGHGTIVGLGSVAGERGRQKMPVYNASKAFLHTYLEALRNRLARKGIKVTTIKPGPVDTEMTVGLGFKGMMSADTAAEIILRKADSGREIFLKPAHWLIFLIIRNIPSAVFRRLKI